MDTSKRGRQRTDAGAWTLRGNGRLKLDWHRWPAQELTTANGGRTFELSAANLDFRLDAQPGAAPWWAAACGGAAHGSHGGKETAAACADGCEPCGLATFPSGKKRRAHLASDRHTMAAAECMAEEEEEEAGENWRGWAAADMIARTTAVAKAELAALFVFDSSGLGQARQVEEVERAEQDEDLLAVWRSSKLSGWERALWLWAQSDSAQAQADAGVEAEAEPEPPPADATELVHDQVGPAPNAQRLIFAGNAAR